MRPTKKNKFNFIRKTLLLAVMFSVLVLLYSFFNKRSSYSNTEYKYSFQYPNEGNITFISAMNGSTAITTADTIGLNHQNEIPIRIQALDSSDKLSDGQQVKVKNNLFFYHGQGQLCSYTISGPNSTLCILVNLSPEELYNNNKILNVFSSMRLY